MKTCADCGVEKPRDTFGPLAQYRDGLDPVCRACRARRGREKRGKACADCGKHKTFRHFGVNGKLKDGAPALDSYCRPCRARRQRERRAELRSTPEGLAKEREQQARWKRNYYRKHREQALATQRAYRARLKADPERYAIMLENARIDAAIRRERAGLPIRKKECRPRYSSENPNLRLPLEPFVAWLEAYRPAMGGDDPAARRVFAYTHGEATTVALTVADAILTANGFNVRDVYAPDEYPWLYGEAAA